MKVLYKVQTFTCPLILLRKSLMFSSATSREKWANLHGNSLMFLFLQSWRKNIRVLLRLFTNFGPLTFPRRPKCRVRQENSPRSSLPLRFHKIASKKLQNRTPFWDGFCGFSAKYPIEQLHSIRYTTYFWVVFRAQT